MNTRTVLLHYLHRLVALLKKIENSKNDSEHLLTARVHENMLPLCKQVQISANFALRISCNEAGTEVVTFDTEHLTYDGLNQQLQSTIDYLQTLPELDIKHDKLAQDTAGFAQLKMPLDEYVGLFALPNFFFHLSMVYAIARAQGLDVTKADFDGIHQYPAGFSWEP